MAITEKKGPIFGREVEQYQSLVRQTFGLLEAVRDEKRIAEGLKENDVSTVIPRSVIELICLAEDPLDVFGLLGTPVPRDADLSFSDGNLNWLEDLDDWNEESYAPLIVEAIVSSVKELDESRDWIGRRVGQIVFEYLEALSIIYHNSIGQGDVGDLEEAILHRDAIDFFCHNLFGEELTTLRHILARLAPDVFLDRWEMFDDEGKITWSNKNPKIN